MLTARLLLRRRTQRLVLPLIGAAAPLVNGLFGGRSEAAHAQMSPRRLEGTANGRVFLGPVRLYSDLVTLRARQSGARTLSVDLGLPQPDSRPGERDRAGGYGLVNVTGAYDGAATTSLRAGGDYWLEVNASGGYVLTIEQPADAPPSASAEHSFSGAGQQVAPLLTLPAGSARLSFTHDGAGAVPIWP